ncbi:hypothetical protein PspLS_09933 [Pyricularia sp. CBS 133598]|nr:hypothetical protein PspLS_09933 [Pyricularia sp. CBS 133598]
MADALAIIPLCLSAFQGVHLLTKTIRVMRNHERLRGRIQRTINFQIMRFTNQLFRVLRDSKCDSAIMPAGVEALLALGQEGSMLPSEEYALESAIRGHFKEQQDVLHDSIKNFIRLVKQANQTVKDVCRPGSLAMQRSVKFVWERSSLKDIADEMKELNEYLTEILETVNHSQPVDSENTASAPPSYSEATTGLGPQQSAVALTKKLDTVVAFEILQKLCPPSPPSPPSPLPRVESGSRPPSPPDSQMGSEKRLSHCPEGSVIKDPVTPAEDVDICREAFSPGEKQIRSEGLCSLAINPTVDFTFEDTDLPPCSRRLRLHGPNMSLAALLRFPKYEVVGDIHCIELALLLSRALLKFYNTKCWPRGCLLPHIKFYTGSDGRDADEIDLAACLDTLHISTTLNAEQSPDNDAANGHYGQPPRGLSDDQLKNARDMYGIENMELYCLGVAFLQIGLWEQIPWRDLEQVRRKARNLNCIGSPYNKLTRKLIQCHFESATTLRAEDLRISVVKDVVKELEGLLRTVRSSH